MGRGIAWSSAVLLTAGLVVGPAFAPTAQAGSTRTVVHVERSGQHPENDAGASEDDARPALAEQARELERLARELAEAASAGGTRDEAQRARLARELERQAREVARLARRERRAGGAVEIERLARDARDQADAHVRVLELGGGGAQLGVVLEDVDADEATRLGLSSTTGVRVREVQPDSAAARAGLASDDVILKYAEQPVWSAVQLRRFVRETPPERQVTLEVWRDKASRRVDVTLGRRDASSARADRERDGDDDFNFAFALPELRERLRDLPLLDEGGPAGGERHLRLRLGGPGGPRRLGLSYQELNGQLARFFKVPGDRGVLVSAVVEGGPAARAGVQAGDVIVGLAGREVADGDDLRAALRERQSGEEVELKVVRQGQALALAVKLGGERG